MRSSIAKQAEPAPTAERRSLERETLVLRVGLIECEGRTSFCLVKNISPAGVQVRLYASLDVGSPVRLRVGDEEALEGRVVWALEQRCGIQFDRPLDPSTLLRVTEKLAGSKRRSSPRVSTDAGVLLRTGGHTVRAQLCDISASGARVRTLRALKTGPSVLLALPDLPPIRAYVRWTDDKEIGLSFEMPIPIEIMARWISEQIPMTA